MTKFQRPRQIGAFFYAANQCCGQLVSESRPLSQASSLRLLKFASCRRRNLAAGAVLDLKENCFVKRRDPLKLVTFVTFCRPLSGLLSAFALHQLSAAAFHPGSAPGLFHCVLALIRGVSVAWCGFRHPSVLVYSWCPCRLPLRGPRQPQHRCHFADGIK